jgi:hypothetical protein
MLIGELWLVATAESIAFRANDTFHVYIVDLDDAGHSERIRS